MPCCNRSGAEPCPEPVRSGSFQSFRFGFSSTIVKRNRNSVQFRAKIRARLRCRVQLRFRFDTLILLPVCRTKPSLQYKAPLNQAVRTCLRSLAVACLTRNLRVRVQITTNYVNFLLRAIHLLCILTCPNDA